MYILFLVSKMCGCLFYSLSYNKHYLFCGSNCSNFGHWERFWGWLLCPFDSPLTLFYLSFWRLLMALQEVPCSACVFLFLALKSAILSRNPSSFFWRVLFLWRNKNLRISYAYIRLSVFIYWPFQHKQNIYIENIYIVYMYIYEMFICVSIILKIFKNYWKKKNFFYFC